MGEPKVGQRFLIKEAPFPVFFEITDIPGLMSGFDGELVVPFSIDTISVKVDHANAEEIHKTTKRPQDRNPVTLSWDVDVDNIEELEDYSIDYHYIRFEFTK